MEIESKGRGYIMSDGKLNFSFRAPESLVRRKSGKKKSGEEKKQEYRTEFMRDRDRIMYCRSFRRLGGKTQIYRAGENDHQRNRLTHTLEVAQLSRTIAIALNLDSDLAEAIALGHDLGHAPFGHAGEEVLHTIMTPSRNNPIKNSPLRVEKREIEGHGLENNVGFKHNIQSVRIISVIDNSYDNDGLDLTNFTLWGILHHSELTYENDSDCCSYRKKLMNLMMHQGENNVEAWSFEAFVVKQADEIAQWHHDLEDALRGNAMTPEEVCNTIEEALKDRLAENTDDKNLFNEIKGRKHVDQSYLAKISHIVIGTLVDWIVKSSRENLTALWEKHKRSDESIEDFFSKPLNSEIEEAIGFDIYVDKRTEVSKKITACSLKRIFRDQIHEKIHHSQEVERMNAKGKFVIERLFKSYYAAPQQLPTGILIQCLLEQDSVFSSWNEALEAGSGAVRINFKKIYEKPTLEQNLILMRKICDHIAGMTDHFALEEYKNLCG